MKLSFRHGAAVLALSLAAASGASAAPTFIFNNVGGSVPVDAVASFQRAADIWSSVLNDDVTIKLDIQFTSFCPPGAPATASCRRTLGGANSNLLVGPKTFWDVALPGDATTAYDAQAMANYFPGGFAHFSNDPNDVAVCPTGAEAACEPLDAREVYLELDGGADNFNIVGSSANLKALGLIDPVNGLDGSSDGFIRFSTDFAFDYDQSDGIDAGSFDFTGIALHEIGHTLGFLSGVDDVDFFALPNGPGAPFAGYDRFAWAYTLDLFRYDTFFVPEFGVDLTLQSLAVGGNPCLSYTGGTDCFATMSSGRFNGDGQQASHFEDDLGLGLMDPTLARGALRGVELNDLIALDLIGWDANYAALGVPAPAGLGLLGLGLVGFGAVRRRRS